MTQHLATCYVGVAYQTPSIYYAECSKNTVKAGLSKIYRPYTQNKTYDQLKKQKETAIKKHSISGTVSTEIGLSLDKC